MSDEDRSRVEELEGILRSVAKADCRDCDGTGVFYGNVTLCHCVFQKFLDTTADPQDSPPHPEQST